MIPKHLDLKGQRCKWQELDSKMFFKWTGKDWIIKTKYCRFRMNNTSEYFLDKFLEFLKTL